MKSNNLFLVLLLVFVLATSAIAEECDCDYHAGGCIISKAAPAGFKCKCVYKGFWTCGGFNVGCHSNEHCPGGCFSHECCIQGGGDCGGYFKLEKLIPTSTR